MQFIENTATFIEVLCFINRLQSPNDSIAEFNPILLMKKIALSPAKVFLLSLIILFQFSCSNDSDLLYDYVAQDPSSNPVQNPSDSDNSPADPTDTPVVTPPDSNIDPDLPGGVNFMGELKAFPDAHGFGKYTTGGRGGTIVEVTNLNDSGPGSLRSAIDMSVPRTIVFKTGGTIILQSPLIIRSGNVTIAGQTAPGGGITISNNTLSVRDGNVIIRYLRVRTGSGPDQDGISILASTGKHVSNIIVDHCSVSWATDENIGIASVSSGGGVSNITIQNSLISNSDKGLLITAQSGDDVHHVSILRNLFAHNLQRSIRAGYPNSDNMQFEMINNLVYGFKWATTVSFGNKFTTAYNIYKASNTTKIDQSSMIEGTDAGEINPSSTYAYIKGNIVPAGYREFDSSLSNYLGDVPYDSSGFIAEATSKIESTILSKVGASFPKRDSYDYQIINDYNNLTGSLVFTGILPNIDPGTPYLDVDKDGMADAWENANGFNPNNASDANEDSDGDGYTNLESFLYALTQG